MDNHGKILLLGSQMETGGAQRLLLHQAEWFQSRGWQVVAVFLYDKEGLFPKWSNEYSFRMIDLHAKQKGAGPIRSAFALLKASFRLYRLMRTEKFSVVETFTHHSNLIGIPLAWLAGIPIRIATHHGRILDFSHRLEKMHARMVNSRMTSSFVVVSDRVYHEAVEEGIHPEKIVIIPNGTQLPELNEFHPEGIRREFKLGDQTKLIITVGRMTAQKAHTYFLKAIPAVLKQFPDSVFALIGDGPLRAELESESQQLGIADNVKFLGIRQDVLRIMSAADLFVLSSRWEGLPMVLLEAMGMGAAVISTNVEGVDQVIKNGENGILVPVEDPELISKAIIHLLTDLEERKRLAKNGQDLIRDEFTFEKMCSRYEQLFIPSRLSEKL